MIHRNDVNAFLPEEKKKGMLSQNATFLRTSPTALESRESTLEVNCNANIC